MEAVKRLFANKLTTDDREPILEFTIPGFHGDKFGLFAPGGEFWKQLGAVGVSMKRRLCHYWLRGSISETHVALVWTLTSPGSPPSSWISMSLSCHNLLSYCALSW